MSAANGIAGGYTIANGVVIENATGGSGDDEITGNAAANVLVGRGGDDVVSGKNGADIIRGKKGDDSLSGGGGYDHIRGGAGADVLNGGSGRDNEHGGRGNDVIIGGRGQDQLTGGRGSDTFVFNKLSHSRNNAVDTITDLRRGIDEIDVSALDADSTRSGNQSFDFVGTADFSATGQIRIERDGRDTIVQADVNGGGRVDFSITLEDVNYLSASDFIL